MRKLILLILVASAPFAASSRGQCVTSCGTERWAVKTGCDPSAGEVDLTRPVVTTIAELLRLDPPQDLHRLSGRVVGVEDRVFVVEATLIEFKSERDKDLHLVLRDQGKTLVAEIPNPACVADNSPFHEAIHKLRPCFAKRFKNAKSHKELNLRVRVTGVGFLDFIHGQTGVAPNGLELHPMLGITFLEDGSTCGDVPPR